MSTFKQWIEVDLDGETYKSYSKALDILNAEQAFARDGGKIEANPTAFRLRIAFTVFKRCHPDHPCAATYGVFLEALDDVREEALLAAQEGDPQPLDPTPPAGSDDSP